MSFNVSRLFWRLGLVDVLAIIRCWKCDRWRHCVLKLGRQPSIIWSGNQLKTVKNTTYISWSPGCCFLWLAVHKIPTYILKRPPLSQGLIGNCAWNISEMIAMLTRSWNSRCTLTVHVLNYFHSQPVTTEADVIYRSHSQKNNNVCLCRPQINILQTGRLPLHWVAD